MLVVPSGRVGGVRAGRPCCCGGRLSSSRPLPLAVASSPDLVAGPSDLAEDGVVDSWNGGNPWSISRRPRRRRRAGAVPLWRAGRASRSVPLFPLPAPGESLGLLAGRRRRSGVLILLGGAVQGEVGGWACCLVVGGGSCARIPWLPALVCDRGAVMLLLGISWLHKCHASDQEHTIAKPKEGHRRLHAWGESPPSSNPCGRALLLRTGLIGHIRREGLHFIMPGFCLWPRCRLPLAPLPCDGGGTVWHWLQNSQAWTIQSAQVQQRIMKGFISPCQARGFATEGRVSAVGHQLATQVPRHNGPAKLLL